MEKIAEHPEPKYHPPVSFIGIARNLSYSVFLLCPSLALVGCGGTSVVSSSASAPVITQQPQSQTIPLGSSVQLSVAAVGDGPLQYQWLENGNILSDQIGNTFTSSSLLLSDSGSEFTVSVTNRAGTVTSKPALITIGPRSPNPRDLRFKHVAFPQPFTSDLSANVIGAAAGPFTTFSKANSLGTPLGVGRQGICAGIPSATGVCDWFFSIWDPPSDVNGFMVTYQADMLANLKSTIQQIGAREDTVITSLDEEPDFDAFALSYEQDTATGTHFAMEHLNVTPSALQQVAQELAVRGSVITAASADSAGDLDLVSYAWTQAGTERYDVQTAIVRSEDVEQKAMSLATDGYILTSVGSVGVGSFVLIGTKVVGDSLPRPFSVLHNNQVAGAANGMFEVGQVYEGTGTATFVEK